MRTITDDLETLARPESESRPQTSLWQQLCLFLRHKPLGALGAVVLCGFIVIAILAPALATHDPDLNDDRTRVKPPSLQH